MAATDAGRSGFTPDPPPFLGRFTAAQTEPTMHTPPITMPQWSTASFGDSADTSPMELSALGAHMAACKTLTGRLFAARCAAEAMHGFVASRIVTTLVVAALLIGAISFIF
jgi:hypothetical protein